MNLNESPAILNCRWKSRPKPMKMCPILTNIIKKWFSITPDKRVSYASSEYDINFFPSCVVRTFMCVMYWCVVVFFFWLMARNSKNVPINLNSPYLMWVVVLHAYWAWCKMGLTVCYVFISEWATRHHEVFFSTPMQDICIVFMFFFMLST